MLQDPQPGDILVNVLDTGVYHYSMSSNYNQLPKPKKEGLYYYQGKSKEVIRRQTLMICCIQ